MHQPACCGRAAGADAPAESALRAEHAALWMTRRRRQTARPACCKCAADAGAAGFLMSGTRGALHHMASKLDGSAGMLRMRGCRGDARLEMGRKSDIASASASSSEPVPRDRIGSNVTSPTHGCATNARTVVKTLRSDVASALTSSSEPAPTLQVRLGCNTRNPTQGFIIRRAGPHISKCQTRSAKRQLL